MDITIGPRYHTLWSPSHILIQYDIDVGRLYYRPAGLPDRPTVVPLANTQQPRLDVWA